MQTEVILLGHIVGRTLNSRTVDRKHRPTQLSVTAVRHGLTLCVGCIVTIIICMYNLGLSAILWEIISSDAWWIVWL